MIEVEVGLSFDESLRLFKRKVERSGLFRHLMERSQCVTIRERKRAKRLRALRRLKQKQGRMRRYDV